MFTNTPTRIGRCNYVCDTCGGDVSMLWAFYQLSEIEKYDEKIQRNKVLKDLEIND